MIKIVNVSLTYDVGTIFQTAALKNVSLTINDGEIVSIVGKIGSGKSTLVQLFNGLISPDSGEVFVDNINVNVKGTDKSIIRKKVGLVFQYPEEQFFAETVFDEVAFGPRNLGITLEELNKSVFSALSEMGFEPEKIAHLSPFNLSGGEKRRVAIASIIAMKPHTIVLDEPTSGLDYINKTMLINYLRNENKKGKTLIFVTHNMEEVLEVANRVIAMKDGEKIFDGATEEFFFSEHFVEEAGLEAPFLVKIQRRIKEKYSNFPFCRTTEEFVQHYKELFS
jgi:energy-coupling factor transport system ATP-binding protein